MVCDFALVWVPLRSEKRTDGFSDIGLAGGDRIGSVGGGEKLGLVVLVGEGGV
jgi:hypothetical protein